MKKYKLAIVGATGLVGRTVLKVLEERNLPISEYVLFASKKSSGKVIHFMNQDYVVKELNENSFDEGFDFALRVEILQENILRLQHLKDVL